MSTPIETVWPLRITRFWNGTEQALQLTPEIYDKSYVQLDQKEIKELIVVLNNAFDTDIYENE